MDDDSDEGNDNEQSDAVQVSLNIGVLEKHVALKMPIGKGMMKFMAEQKETNINV